MVISGIEIRIDYFLMELELINLELKFPTRKIYSLGFFNSEIFIP